MTFSVVLHPASGEVLSGVSLSSDMGVAGCVAPSAALEALAKRTIAAALTVDAGGIKEWDSGVISWLLKLDRAIQAKGQKCQWIGIPDGAKGLLKLATAVAERKGARRSFTKDSLIASVGRGAVSLWRGFLSWCDFIGELIVSMYLAVRGRARVPVRDIWVTLDECGPGALPIVTLISVLVGVILGFIGAQQLRQFGAEIYVANLVGIAMVREMGAIMAGIIMAGRTGAAFAAQLGTMQVNEEIDALKTFGFSPMEYLVVPRIISLIIMMPLLCIYADVLGMAGGALISSLALDISLERYFQQLVTAVLLKDILIGVAKSCVFGILIACAGCLCGMRCGRSASAVGIAVTSAVVSGIVAIVISDAVFAFICEVLKI